MIMTILTIKQGHKEKRPYSDILRLDTSEGAGLCISGKFDVITALANREEDRRSLHLFRY